MNLFIAAFTLALFLLFPGTGLYAETTADIITHVENNLNGQTAQLTTTMIVTTKRSTRTIQIKSFSVGTDKSFVKILSPKKDRGITFLKLDNTMWQYVPKIERTIKIPASMMRQNWMGSDFTNDDLVKESSITHDYHSKLLKTTDSEYTIELTPKKEAAVVWGRIVMKILKDIYLPSSVDYYDEEGLLVRTIHYQDLKSYNGRLYPGRWRITPHSPEKSGNQTLMLVDEAIFDQQINDEYFSKHALKRFSR